MASKREKAARIAAILDERFPQPGIPLDHGDPFQLLCAVLFGLIHLSWGRMIPTMLLGMAFALAVRLAGSLWVPVAMHAMNNALVVLMVRRGLSSFVELGWTVRIGLVPVAGVLLWTVLRLLGRGTAAWESARDA